VDDKERVKRVKSVRLRKQIIRVIEEGFKKQTAMLLGSELDLSKSEKTPDTESRNTPELDVHIHNHVCPEIQKRFVPNGHSCKQSDDNFISKRNFTNCYNNKILKRYGGEGNIIV
jgi:hypothetical protein